jgi:hypothetical protein
MREIRTSSSMRGRRKRATSQRACALLYRKPLAIFSRALELAENCPKKNRTASRLLTGATHPEPVIISLDPFFGLRIIAVETMLHILPPPFHHWLA